ncbi:MAG: efflux RND transporter periplasmic adaptor subunit [Candidatus Omnitrophica bacterium]|nr:efflux RND transporter periplasmic adaptor subunit [Candidatus Omnitrophota bacterium]
MKKTARFLYVSLVFLFSFSLYTSAQDSALDKFRKRKEEREEEPLEKKSDRPKAAAAQDDQETVPGTEKQEIPVMTFAVTRLPEFKETLSVLGTITPFTQVDLSFPLQGVVKKIYVEEGEEVEEGQLLAELDEKDFILRSEFSEGRYEAEASVLRSMDKELEIKEQLYEMGAILAQTIDKIKLQVEAQRHRAESAKKEWELAQEALKRIKLYSPARGKLDKRNIEEGEFVSPNQVAMTILKIDRVYADIGITERDISKVKRGQLAELSVEAYPQQVFQGSVTNISPSIKGSSRTLALRIEVDNKKYNYQLLPGMFVKGNIILSQLRNVYVVPKDSLFFTGNTYGVYTVVPQGEFSYEDLEEGKLTGEFSVKNVVPVYMGEEYVAITQGLREGELVVTQMQGKVNPFAIAKIISIEQYEETETLEDSFFE